jgi:chromosomal replication initiation ATPase DnaA
MTSLLEALNEEHKARQERIKRAAVKNTEPPRVIHDFSGAEERKKNKPKIKPLLTFDIILNEVCEYYNVRKLDILSSRRLRNISVQRHMLAYMLYRMTSFTNNQIAPKMNRDPTTIGYAIKKMIDSADQFKEDIEELEKRISEILAQRGKHVR